MVVNGADMRCPLMCSNLINKVMQGKFPRRLILHAHGKHNLMLTLAVLMRQTANVGMGKEGLPVIDLSDVQYIMRRARTQQIAKAVARAEHNGSLLASVWKYKNSVRDVDAPYHLVTRYPVPQELNMLRHFSR